MEGILHVLADPVRVAIYAGLAASEKGTSCSAFLQLDDREIPKSTLSQHFRALREAGLIRSERQGVEMRNTTRCAEINERFPGLLPAVMAAYQQQLADRMKAAKRKGGKARGG
ncbi:MULTISPECIES: ArsR/SmtB family transcription factor [Gammaproteobacteria]|uniref:Transcriptional regulator n=1 Tax=Xanthomonas boreopolis TaxID=86183 RepID=A0A919KGH4_9XANT|nr:helix-turn-helix domain-containing protein [Pseudomonas sp. Hp2]GHH46580.1 transcriptional regulator [[Pseudomonas] boreopolis]